MKLRGGLIVAAAWLLLSGGAGLAAAGDAKSPYNLDFRAGWAGYYRPGRWMPVELFVQTAGKDTLDGQVEVAALQDELTTATVRQPIVLTPEAPLYLPLVTRIAPSANDITVRLADKTGRVQWEQTYSVYGGAGNPRAWTAVADSDLLVGMVSWPGASQATCAAAAGLRLVPRHAVFGGFANGTVVVRVPDPVHIPAGRVCLADKPPRYLPWDWTGYDCLDVLVLLDPDWSAMNGHQCRAIVQWVGRGGTLLIVPGSHPLPADNPIAALLPFGVDKPQEVQIDAAQLRALHLVNEQSGGPPVYSPGANLARREHTAGPRGVKISRWFTAEAVTKSGAAAGWEVVGEAKPNFFIAAGPADLGRVGVLSSNPGELGDSEASISRLAALWVDQLNGARKGQQRVVEYSAAEVAESAANYGGNQGGETARQAGESTNAVMQYLLTIPQLKPPDIWWVIGLLAALAVLIGPVDYLVLKKLDRQPWTWATCIVTIGLFTGGAYYGVSAVRSGPMRVRGITILDAAQAGKSAGPVSGWATTYTGIFASASGDYRLTGLSPGQWWLSITMSRDEYGYRYGPSMNEEVAGRRVGFVQADGQNQPDSLPINIWSMQCLLAEYPIEGGEFKAKFPLSARVTAREINNGRGATVKITNHSNVAIDDGFVRVGADASIPLGRVEPGQTKEVSGSARDTVSPARWEAATHINWFYAVGTGPRTAAMDAWLANGGAVVIARYDHAPPPNTVAGEKCECDHVQIVRLAVPVEK